MIVNGKSLLGLAPIKNMEHLKQRSGDVTYGLGEAGYDIRIAEDVVFHKDTHHAFMTGVLVPGDPYGPVWSQGRFALASAIEEFDMPNCLVGVVHDKSSWARKGLSVFNTVIEPGWRGFLTLELVYHGDTSIRIPAGSGIAQVIFHIITDPSFYEGRYQDQPKGPVPAIPAR